MRLYEQHLTGCQQPDGSFEQSLVTGLSHYSNITTHPISNALDHDQMLKAKNYYNM